MRSRARRRLNINNKQPSVYFVDEGEPYVLDGRRGVHSARPAVEDADGRDARCEAHCYIRRVIIKLTQLLTIRD